METHRHSTRRGGGRRPGLLPLGGGRQASAESLPQLPTRVQRLASQESCDIT